MLSRAGRRQAVEGSYRLVGNPRRVTQKYAEGRCGMRRICESCEMGYTSTATTCPWCGCDAALSHTSDITSVMDTECYVDYWLCMFETGEVFQLAHDITLDIPGLRRALSTRMRRMASAAAAKKWVRSFHGRFASLVSRSHAS